MAHIKKVKKILGLKGTIAVVTVVGLLAGGAGAWAQMPTSAKDYVLVKVADLAEKTGNAELASKLLDSLSAPVPAEEFGGSILRNEGSATRLGEICRFEVREDTDGTWCSGIVVEKISSASSTFFANQNRFGEHVFITGVVFMPDGTVSSSMRVNMGTSTVSALLPGVSASSSVQIFDNALMATGTNMTYPLQSGYGPIKSITGTMVPFQGGSATGTSKWIPWANGEYVVGTWRAENPLFAVTTTIDRGIGSESRVWLEYVRFTTTTNWQ